MKKRMDLPRKTTRDLDERELVFVTGGEASGSLTSVPAEWAIGTQQPTKR